MSVEKKTDNGGAAFPSYQSDHRGKASNTTFEPVSGLTMRDYFAAAALTGLVAQYSGKAHGTHESYGATYAYKMADAMLAARKETE